VRISVSNDAQFLQIPVVLSVDFFQRVQKYRAVRGPVGEARRLLFVMESSLSTDGALM